MKEFSHISFLKDFRVGVFILLLLVLVDCTKEESSVDSIVRFETTDQQISTDDLYPVMFFIRIDPPASVRSHITVDLKASGGVSGRTFKTNPSAVEGTIEIPVEATEGQTSVSIIPVEEAIGFSNVVIDLEIIEGGEGLSAEGLYGIYSSLTILNNKNQQRSIPFLESFDGCETGQGGIPAGWEEKVVRQNSFGTAHWVCSGSFRGMESNAFISEGIKNDSSEVWLLSPPVSLKGALNPRLSFDADRRFDIPDFQEYDVKISTDYDGNNFENAEWEVYPPAVTAIEANDPDLDDFETMNRLDLSVYEDEIITIAFVYYARGSGRNSTIFRLDDVKIE